MDYVVFMERVARFERRSPTGAEVYVHELLRATYQYFGRFLVIYLMDSQTVARSRGEVEGP